MLLYIGTYTKNTASYGIYTLDFDSDKQTFNEINVTQSTNPSFLSAYKNNLYTVNELPDAGSIESFGINSDGSLYAKNKILFAGSASCHIAVHPQTRSVYAANYGSGNIAGFTLLPDGVIGKNISLIQHEGSGPNKSRQQSAHAHSVNITPDGRYLLAADLGADKIFIYSINNKDGSLTVNKNCAYAPTPPGEGPRHMTFNNKASTVYVISELKNNVLVYDYKAETGTLTQMQSISVLPEEFTGESISADIHISPDNRFLYASSRGWNGISAFSIAPDGLLSEVKHYEGFGKTPRNFAVSPDGEYVFIAYQDSDSIAAVKRDIRTGEIKELVAKTTIPTPVCILISE